MEKKLFYTNHSEREAIQANAELARQNVQSVVDTFNALGLEALKPEEFPRLFTDTDALVFDKITGGSLELQGVRIDKTKAMELVQKPDGYQQLTSAIFNLEKAGREGFVARGDDRNKFSVVPSAIAGDFALVDGRVVFSKRTLAYFDNAGKYFLSTEKGQKVFGYVEDVVKSFFAHGLQEYFPEGAYHDYHQLTTIIKTVIKRLDYDAGTFIPDESATITTYDRQP